MALCSLGRSIDVLLGGADLTFPHHAYQVAMVEAATDVRPFAATVLHVGEVRSGGRKMAKSTGNLVLLADLLERHPTAALRLGLLMRRWDEPWECEEAVFVQAARTVEELASMAGDRGAPTPPDLEVLTTLATELDVPGAVERALAGGPDAARYLLRLLKLHDGTAVR
jgi:cysteinyl-tRNA synthetase